MNDPLIFFDILPSVGVYAAAKADQETQLLLILLYGSPYEAEVGREEGGSDITHEKKCLGGTIHAEFV